ncbi:hypothetical protein BC829DRAFT_400380 [Chytridium lagenaria]|nr:hypothetical protein BC829DRAFT_400380 [Chytridium lagenaria]
MAPPKIPKGKKKTEEIVETFESLMEAASEFEDQGERYRTGVKARNNYERAAEKYEAAVALQSKIAMQSITGMGRVLYRLAEFEFPPLPHQKRLELYEKSISLLPNCWETLKEADAVFSAVYEAQVVEYKEQEQAGMTFVRRRDARIMIMVTNMNLTLSLPLRKMLIRWVARMRVLLMLREHSADSAYFVTAESMIDLAEQEWLPKLTENSKDSLDKAKDRLDRLAVLPDLGIAAAALLRERAEVSLQNDGALSVPSAGGSSSSSSSTNAMSWKEQWEMSISLLQRILNHHPKCTEAACDRGDALVELADAHLTLAFGSATTGSRLDLFGRLNAAMKGASPDTSLDLLENLSADDKNLITQLRLIYKNASAAYLQASRIDNSRGNILNRLAEIELFRAFLFPVIDSATLSSSDQRKTLISNAETYYRMALKNCGFKTIPTAYKQSDDDETVRLAFLGLSRVLSHSLDPEAGKADQTLRAVRETLMAWRKWGGEPDDLVDAPLEFSTLVSGTAWFKDLTFAS